MTDARRVVIVAYDDAQLLDISCPSSVLACANAFGAAPAYAVEAAAADDHLVGHVRRLAAGSRRVASVCTGATVLAAAGLLDHRRATTHWDYGERLAARYPAVAVDTAPPLPPRRQRAGPELQELALRLLADSQT